MCSTVASARTEDDLTLNPIPWEVGNVNSPSLLLLGQVQQSVGYCAEKELQLCSLHFVTHELHSFTQVSYTWAEHSYMAEWSLSLFQSVPKTQQSSGCSSAHQDESTSGHMQRPMFGCLT